MWQAKRQVALDIETTGLSVSGGHRIVEIAAIELIDGEATGRSFHHRLNPEREIDPEVSSINGMTLDTLKSEPKFSEIAEEFMDFVVGAELIMQYARFDLEFLNAELAQSMKPELTNPVIDTLVMARALYPGQKNHLDALIERHHINQSCTAAKGLLLDVKAIADVYRAMAADWHSFCEVGHDNTCESVEGGSKFLDLAEAKRFLVHNPPITNTDADLSAYTQGTPEAFDFLGKQGYDWVVIGLAELDQDIARAFSGWEAWLNFENIRSLDAEVAGILADSQNALVFAYESLGEINSEVARELGKLEGYLSLRVERLTIEVASELTNHADGLTLDLDTPPDVHILQELCFHAGYQLAVSWDRPSGGEPCEAPLHNPNKKTFVTSHLNEQTGRWCDVVYIGDPWFYSDM
ncbi:MAG: exonuclease domain-containing protein [Gallionella sp.]|nr:exonuclease domain-containing protein [Gallionella sp.]MDD4945352.1 exonuclease domain-containing protein [Gallionella sp.]MDD5612100.1 exonuclease domain-containing protein [Gallionella sp.]